MSPSSNSQNFFRELDKKLWTAADRLRSNLDDALGAVEKENVNGAERHRLPARGARRVRAGARIKLKNVLNKNYTQLQIDPANLAGLIDLIATIPFQHADLSTSRQITAATSVKDRNCPSLQDSGPESYFPV